MKHNPFERDDNLTPTENGSAGQLGVFTPDDVRETYQLREKQLHQLSLVLHQPDPDSSSTSLARPVLESNQRQYSRCPITEERTNAILSINGRQFDCRLVELSIGGFGVFISGTPKFASGAAGSLRAPGLNYLVSVTHQEPRDGGVYIGLRQLEEVIEPGYIPGQATPFVGYLIAGLAGAFMAATAYCLMTGT